MTEFSEHDFEELLTMLPHDNIGPNEEQSPNEEQESAIVQKRKKFKCDIGCCGKVYPHVRNLYRHKSECHKEIYEQQKSEKREARKFTCIICRKGYRSVTVMKEHIRQKHRDYLSVLEPIKFCEDIGIKFTSLLDAENIYNAIALEPSLSIPVCCETLKRSITISTSTSTINSITTLNTWNVVQPSNFKIAVEAIIKTFLFKSLNAIDIDYFYSKANLTEAQQQVFDEIRRTFFFGELDAWKSHLNVE